MRDKRVTSPLGRLGVTGGPATRLARQLRELSNGLKAAFDGSNVIRRVQDFERWTNKVSRRDSEVAYDHTPTVREYYDLCSDFMVWGWGESLHFAPRSLGESLEDSKIRHQQLMISKLELRPGMTVVDIGCGIGGPMRRVAREAGVRVVGVNISEVQSNKAKRLNAAAGLDHVTDCLVCSFTEMSAIADKTFDSGYAIESTCHAADKAAAFAEIYRVLKPGALFWGQEMCMTDMFDPGNDRHRTIKRELMHGIALKEIATFREVNRALETAGFEVMEGLDRAVDQPGPITPWYQPMETRGGLLGGAFLRIPMGRKAMRMGSKMAESLGVFPKGSADVVGLLDRTASAYVAGGRTGIFTPLYCFVARRPLRG